MDHRGSIRTLSSRVLVTLAAVLALGPAAAEPAAAQAMQANEAAQEEVVLNDLDSLEELQEKFNQDAGKSRLVLLLSPT